MDEIRGEIRTSGLQTVWVAFSGDYEQRDLLGVFTDEQAAAKAAGVGNDYYEIALETSYPPARRRYVGTVWAKHCADPGRAGQMKVKNEGTWARPGELTDLEWRVCHWAGRRSRGKPFDYAEVQGWDEADVRAKTLELRRWMDEEQPGQSEASGSTARTDP